MKQNSGEKFFVFFSFVQIALLIISFWINYICLLSDMDHAYWTDVGGPLREWYWYEHFIFVLLYLIPILIIVNAIALYVKMKRKCRLAAGCYIFASLVVATLLWDVNAVCSLALAYLLGIILCVIGIIFHKKIARPA